MSVISLDIIETEERTADVSLLPGFSKRDEIYVHKNPAPEDDNNFSTGDLAGYDSNGDLWVVKTEGWEYHDIDGNQNEGEVYLHYAEEALDLEVAGYLDPEHHFHGDNFVTGNDLYTVANHNLEEVERKLDGMKVQLVG
ncbi:MAG: hypothetical protein ACI9LV_000569 [Candidatus Nanohaloarchaea archaeon]